MSDVVPTLPTPMVNSDYWRESRQPLASLLFISPLLIIYEIGILILGTDAARNGVDVWLRTFLDWVGLGQYFLLPLLTVGILLGWQHTTRQPWRVSSTVLCGMAVECALLAICLRVILQLQSVMMHIAPSGTILSASSQLSGLIMFLGAGIYEELLFRLILLTASVWLLRRFGLSRGMSIAVAVVATSLLFSAAHYFGPYGERIDLFGFSFRFVAGLFFCALFVYRGFGIAAGAHAGYDILIGVLP